MKKLFVLLIKLYQLCIKPFFPNCCRYYPSCSEYTKGSIIKHGVFFGILLGIIRILRCGPWSKGGIDPVPDKLSFTCIFTKRSNEFDQTDLQDEPETFDSKVCKPCQKNLL